MNKSNLQISELEAKIIIGALNQQYADSSLIIDQPEVKELFEKVRKIAKQ